MQQDYHTPLPYRLIQEHEHKKHRQSFFPVPLVAFFGFVILVVALVGGWYLYVDAGFFASSSLSDKNNVPTPTLMMISPIETPPLEEGKVGADWTRQLNKTCGTTFFVPPAQEPYLIPRDPNTLPSATDDEGKYWIYEDYKNNLFMFEHLARVIFKNPELSGSGYVSSAVEVMCAPNTQGYTTESLFVKIQNDLLQNFSVVSLASSEKANLWDREVKAAVFEGGTFNDDTYYLFATDNYIYMVRRMGESSNHFVQQVRDSIFLNLKFE